MNLLELRYKLYAYLSGLAQPAAIKSIEMVSPNPGGPVALEIGVTDPYSPDLAVRKYRITIEEITDGGE